MNEESLIDAPLVARLDERPRGGGDSWGALPWHVKFTRDVLIKLSPSQKRWMQVIFCLSSMGVFGVTMNRYAASLDEDPPSILFHTFLQIEVLLAMVLCPFCMSFMREVFLSSDVPTLFQNCSLFDPHLRTKFLIFDVFNACGIIATLASFILWWRESVAFKVVLVLYACVFLWPYCAAFALALCLLEAHRVHALHFLSELEGITLASDALGTQSLILRPSTLSESLQLYKDIDRISILGLGRRYFEVHDQFHRTSARRGRVIAFFFVFVVLYLTAVLWNAFRVYGKDELHLHQDAVMRALFMQALYAIFMMAQLGLLLSFTNETGHLVPKALSRCLLSHSGALAAEELQHATLLMSNVGYAKIEIPFWGNFTLRSSHIVALITSSFAALITILLQ